MSNKSKKKFEEFDEFMITINGKLKETHENLKTTLNENKEQMKEEMTSFFISLNKDLDFKQKNNDAKIANLTETVLINKKIVQGFPSIAEIDKNISIATENMRNILKTEINEIYLQPEITKITEKFFEIQEFDKIFEKNFEDFQKNLAFEIKEKNSKNFEAFANLEKSINTLQSLLEHSQKELEKEFSKTLEKHSKTLEALNISFHETNHKYFVEFKILQKELEENRNQYKTVNDDISSIKKELKERNETNNPSEPENKNIEKSFKTSILTKKTFKNHSEFEDISKQLSKLQKFVNKHNNLLEQKLNREINDYIRPLEQKLKEKLYSAESDLIEIKEKLS
jgi:hypothetical protein